MIIWLCSHDAILLDPIMAKHLEMDELLLLGRLFTAVQNDQYVVSCVGLYNHGKSTLLNAIVGDFECSTFKTADTRETSSIKRIKRNDLFFVDTPGLNAREYDDKLTIKATNESDINLFIHNVTTGELDKNEIDFLYKMNNNQTFIDKTIFVLSRIDNIDNQQDIDKTNNKIFQQIEKIFNYHATIVTVSAKNYLKGNRENKKLLIKNSNIVTLKEKIESFSKRLKSNRKEDFEKHCSLLLDKLSSKIQQNKLESNKLELILEHLMEYISFAAAYTKSKIQCDRDKNSTIFSGQTFIADIWFMKKEKESEDIKNYKQLIIMQLKQKYDVDIEFTGNTLEVVNNPIELKLKTFQDEIVELETIIEHLEKIKYESKI